MLSVNKISAKVRSINSSRIHHYACNEMRKKLGRKDDSFMVVDSAEIDLTLSMTPAKTDDAAILYVDKGELSIMHDLK